MIDAAAHDSGPAGTVRYRQRFWILSLSASFGWYLLSSDSTGRNRPLIHAMAICSHRVR